ncbi:MAG: ABC transporter substrate-binding protein [Planctomycetaceae bacterium]|nr:ABC transporter substrate-binding protein [Planctomycetaceae bacterium]
MKVLEGALRLLSAAPFALVGLLVFSSCGEMAAGPGGDRAEAASRRIVVLGGAAGELVEALGMAEHVVGADSSALAAADLREGVANVGYVRAVPVEGVVSLFPDLVFATAELGPKESLAQLDSLGVRVVCLPDGHGVEAVRARMHAAGEALGAEERARSAAAALDRELLELARRVESAPRQVRALWLLQPGGGAPLVGGSGTAAEAVLALAGAENCANGLRGWQSLSLEALLELSPEVAFVASPRFEPGQIDAAALAQLWPALAAAERNLAPRFVALEPAALGGGPSLPRHAEAVRAALERVARGGGGAAQ